MAECVKYSNTNIPGCGAAPISATFPAWDAAAVVAAYLGPTLMAGDQDIARTAVAILDLADGTRSSGYFPLDGLNAPRAHRSKNFVAPSATTVDVV